MAVRSKYTHGTTRKERPLRKVHKITVSLHPKIPESDLKRFLKWYWTEMSPENPIPPDVKRILREVSLISEAEKKRFMQDDQWLMPANTLRRQSAKKKNKTAAPSKRVVKITLRRRKV